jgi:high affinity Mn2+ porin
MSTCHNAFIESGNAISRMAGSAPAGGDNITGGLVTPRIDHRVASLRTAMVRWVLLLRCVCLYALPCDAVFAADSATDADQRAPGAVTISMPEAPPAQTADATPLPWNLHGQATFVEQFHPAFRSPYEGANSLTPASNHEETADLTLFAGVGLWRGAAFYINPEVDQGFGLSDTLGVAGFPSGEAYKVGQSKPYARLQRAFVRQRFDLGGANRTVEPGPNELGGASATDNVTVTVGKFSVVDIFDANAYAHDPRADFFNWSVIDAAAFDYAADAWGYTIGGAVEWTQSWWTLRGGVFELSNVPNSKTLEPAFKEFALIEEFEGRYDWRGHPGKVKLLAFLNYGRMGSYDAAVSLAQANGTTPDTALVRHFSSRGGAALNLEQELTSDLGAFARLSLNDGSKEAYEFTDVNQSLSLGLLLKGSAWSRPDDVVGVATAFNRASSAARSYFAAGGLGILIGDGQLPHAASENIIETFYSLRPDAHFSVSADYQYVANPAYNRDRGPVSIVALRVHAEF